MWCGARSNDCTADSTRRHRPGGRISPTSRGLHKRRARPRARCRATCSQTERRRGLLRRCKPRGAVTQPGHRVRLWADILPALQHGLELTAIPSSIKHEHLTSLVPHRAKPCHVELAGPSHPRGAIKGPVDSNPPPQPDVLLPRRSAAAVRPIEVAQRLVSAGPINERPPWAGHLSPPGTSLSGRSATAAADASRDGKNLIRGSLLFVGLPEVIHLHLAASPRDQSRPPAGVGEGPPDGLGHMQIDPSGVGVEVPEWRLAAASRAVTARLESASPRPMFFDARLPTVLRTRSLISGG
jgi:hypothetical protein